MARHAILMKCFILNGIFVILFSIVSIMPYTSLSEQNIYELQIEQILSSNRIPSLNYEQCKLIVNKGSIHFMEHTTNITRMYGGSDGNFKHQYPMYLYSYGGSGNTMTRLLLEYITNIYTGSIYSDHHLYDAGFKGDNYVCSNVLLIKHHPENRFDEINKKHLRHICHKQSKFGFHDTIWNNMSAIFIVRNPWNAAFSMYQFKFGDEEMINGVTYHTRHLLKSNWNGTHFANYVQIGFNKLLKTFELMDLYQQYQYDYIVIKYENLVNLKEAHIAINETDKMLKYLYDEKYYNEIENMLFMKMECIFNFLMKNDYERFGLIHRKPANSSIHVTFDFAYNYMIKNQRSMLCKLWDQIKNKVNIYQYQMLNSMDCG